MAVALFETCKSLDGVVILTGQSTVNSVSFVTSDQMNLMMDNPQLDVQGKLCHASARSCKIRVVEVWE